MSKSISESIVAERITEALQPVMNAKHHNKTMQTNDANQKIYDNGLGKVEFSRFSTVKHGYKVTAQTTGNVGPQIDENKVKSSAVGKKTEEIKTELAKNTGVSDVDVKMGPFWVTTAPKADKIKVNFTIEQ